MNIDKILRITRIDHKTYLDIHIVAKTHTQATIQTYLSATIRK